MKVLVTGATGLLGCTLVPLLRSRGHHVTSVGYSRAGDLNIDLMNYENVARALNQAKPEVIVNLAALTDVERCEMYPQEAYLLNVKTVENLCVWMKTLTEQDCHLIQISTDQLYDGPGPHSEDELTICNYYAMSKLAGEFVAATVSHTILRTNFVGRSRCEGRGSLTDWLYLELRNNSPINIFKDLIFSPVAISTLCDCIERSVVERPNGVFNLGSRLGMSKADFACAFAAELGFQTTNLSRVNSSFSRKMIARRPADMRLNSERFEQFMGLKMPRLIDEIQLIADDYQ